MLRMKTINGNGNLERLVRGDSVETLGNYYKVITS